MATVVFGSARHDENGKYVGGKAGDQAQKTTDDYNGEVSLQTGYVSSKGWEVYRALSADYANALAAAMLTACNNSHIGYDQNTRTGVIKYGVNTKTNCNADCSSLVRACIIAAGMKDPGNFTTANEGTKLLATGQFEKIGFTTLNALATGDILVTKTKGHTVIVTIGKQRVGATANKSITIPAAKPNLMKGSKGTRVTQLQHAMNEMAGAKLKEDGDFGSKTDTALRNVQTFFNLKVDGVYGTKSRGAFLLAAAVQGYTVK